MLRTLVLATALVIGSGAANVAVAQQQQAQANRAATPDPSSFVQTSQQIAALVDQNQLAALYDSASTATKAVVSRDDFVNGIMAQRRALGAAPSVRNWWSISRQMIPAGGQAPQGTYVSVRFISTLANNTNVMELVSFRLDEDGTWRLAGYAIQQ